MKLYLRTFGCRANQYDTEAVRAMALASDVELVSTPAQADVALFNSCAVTAEAEADLRQQVRRAARANPGIRSVIMGCASSLADQRGDASLRELPRVESTVAGADLTGIAAALGLATPALRTSAQTGARALLRIQDGCDEHCTFCATTLARGANRSRSVEQLVEEAGQLALHHPEIVLTGVHIGSFGADIGSGLALLVTRLIDAVPAVRFRLSSIEATEVDAQLAELLTSAPRRVAPYLHAPLQSGSDRVLRRMGRHWYTAATYRAAIEALVRRTSVFGLGADIITGFPGETAEDHAETLAMVRALPFTSLHVFPWSERPGASAARLPDRVNGALARERAQELRSLADEKAAAYRTARAGTVADVVIIRGGVSGREGLTEDYLSVLPASVNASRGERFDAHLRLDDGQLVAHSDPV